MGVFWVVGCGFEGDLRGCAMFGGGLGEGVCGVVSVLGGSGGGGRARKVNGKGRSHMY